MASLFVHIYAWFGRADFQYRFNHRATLICSLKCQSKISGTVQKQTQNLCTHSCLGHNVVLCPFTNPLNAHCGGTSFAEWAAINLTFQTDRSAEKNLLAACSISNNIHSYEWEFTQQFPEITTFASVIPPLHTFLLLSLLLLTQRGAFKQCAPVPQHKEKDLKPDWFSVFMFRDFRSVFF